MAQTIGTFDTAHTDAIHDAQFDYYGKRFATASGDHSIRIWDVSDGQQRCCGELQGHEGPVWKISWAHPKFGNVLASCSYDMKVIVWKEVAPNNWQIAYADQSHAASVNDVEFCPQEYGMRLACASSDGTVSVLFADPNTAQWNRTFVKAHPNGASCVSWAPANNTPQGLMPPRLVTGGCDSQVRIWKCDEATGQWVQEQQFLQDPHTDWVKAVAWRPGTGGANIIASASLDKTAIVWMQDLEGQPWRQQSKLKLPDKVWALSWSVTGSLLSVSYGENETTLYKETLTEGVYEQVTKITDTEIIDVAPPPPQPPQSPAIPQPGVNLGGAPPAGGAPPTAPPTGAPQSLGAALEEQQKEHAAAAAQAAAQQASVMESFGSFE